MESHERTLRLAQQLAGGVAEPVAHQIVENIWVAVVEGTLETGERLPTARQLAIALGVSPRTVERAYRQLEQRGVIVARPGEGTFVTLAAPSEEERARHRAFAALCGEAVDRARELGYGVDELIDALSDYRLQRQTDPRED
ncbi:MAG: GntR family transcriptional regulator [Gemmatimonadetes bacterium]|nr:GntR family transcriptional regulator [Gemmatimonadota bacterium]NIQ56651.1 GntR family transcriptional regulator [Gemmatimonadota bacterium]NIU76840.1 GntR family transcriptional regulator [Gammaproteobacteria bacterium]NIX46225.1 GntR family transcriptional regulator [Gemmatimonadota bacterium]NIY10557.1 GntR family transcriptional regulator [Gemmatimonadota bacterium]